MRSENDCLSSSAYVAVPLNIPLVAWTDMLHFLDSPTVLMQTKLMMKR